ncbi:hypothetical protein N7451_003269 [Penicillium sp. IBT 35674x]|nr:hypothetical protein N7451_003269 [Penicillium sp. IBT 35674x]
MSGILGSAITPCPSRSRFSGYSDHSGSDTFDSLIGGDTECENTEQIDFTIEIRGPTMTGVRPRRSNRAGSGFQIHDEGVEKPPGPAEKRQRPNGTMKLQSDRKSSLLAQPAQRFRPKVGFTPNQPQTVNVKQETETKRRPERLDSRLDSNPKTQPSHRMGPAAQETTRSHSDPGLKKNVRRNTVYIPPDDATVPSVFMGLFSPLKKQPGTAPSHATEDTKINTLEARIANRQARKSMAIGARKAPLQPSTKIAQEAASRMDVAGKNGGKENIPPGTLFQIEEKADPQARPLVKPRISTMSSSKPNPLSRTVRSAEVGPVAPKQPLPKRDVLGNKQNNAKSSAVCGSQNRIAEPRGPPPSTSLNTRVSALSDRRGRSGSNSTTRLRNISSKLRELNHDYPKLNEDIKKPALYEDDWLSHQETVITQLVNALFECSNGDLAFHDQDCLRLELLELYHTDNFIQLHKKLRASLSCGALNISKHALAHSSRLRQDVGLRRKFLEIWIHSYDLHALAAAAETVIGRQISNDPDLFQNMMESGNNTRCTKAIARKLENFLYTFLLRNEDLDQSQLRANETPAEAQAKVYRRTVLRCIMLVALLDQAKQSLGSSLPRRLFVPSSPLKSSVDVLQALTRVLLPSCGDILKPLSHLGCRLSYHQHQLLEYNYQMDNIAVDLRDGVRLTRLVEVLFITASHTRRETEDQTEVTLNTGEALSLLGEHADVPLSKHLKFPCVSRAAKVFNVQLALSALESIKGCSAILHNVRAEDIVDGYREKTIALLWALVGKRGLSGLVDWDDLNTEISRLKRKALLHFGPQQVKYEAWFTGEQSGDDQHEHLLQHWAGLLAGLKSLQINNMSTSFANGRIYESIIDEYEPYITGSQDLNTNGRSASMSLEKRLGLLGCSSQFAHLVSPSSTSSHVLNRDFTLGALAFLCSRLLSSSKRARAATVLQRAWRAHLEDRTYLRRTMAKNLATHCAAVVQTRNEILWAKKVILRWWRQVKSRRVENAARPRSLRKPDWRPAGLL